MHICNELGMTDLSHHCLKQMLKDILCIICGFPPPQPVARETHDMSLCKLLHLQQGDTCQYFPEDQEKISFIKAKGLSMNPYE